MKALNQFQTFDWAKLSEGKQFAVTQVSEYTDFDTGAHLGTKVEVVIIVDKTPYQFREGNEFTNRFEKLVFKCTKDLDIPLDARVEPKGVTATVFGDYRNKLSVKCDDVTVLALPKVKADA